MRGSCACVGANMHAHACVNAPMLVCQCGGRQTQAMRWHTIIVKQALPKAGTAPD